MASFSALMKKRPALQRTARRWLAIVPRKRAEDILAATVQRVIEFPGTIDRTVVDRWIQMDYRSDNCVDLAALRIAKTEFAFVVANARSGNSPSA
ncbi:MAG: hypothetical protein GKS00_25990 [Alphaproteobacteria bacterium]|nr:hypothetical protein [Alphaproteobacteria bacterium]